jgi:thiol peroxidase
MATITVRGNTIHTAGTLPAKGSVAKEFALTKGDLSEVSLASFGSKKKLLNIFPSLDTAVCSLSVKKFAEQVNGIQDVVTLNISKDLPFAQGRFCKTEGVTGVETLSAFRSSFAKDYGLEITDGPLKGLCSRAVLVLDEHNQVIYSEQVPEITQEPDYAKALDALRGKA